MSAVSSTNIQGTFYEQELQKTTQDVYRIEKVIKRKGNKVLVKWKGYPDEFNSWVDKNELIDLYLVAARHHAHPRAKNANRSLCAG